MSRDDKFVWYDGDVQIHIPEGMQADYEAELNKLMAEDWSKKEYIGPAPQQPPEWWQGWTDRVDGIAYGNPFDEGTEQFDLYERGWAVGDREREQEEGYERR